MLKARRVVSAAVGLSITPKDISGIGSWELLSSRETATMADENLMVTRAETFTDKVTC